jgi:hypothetical protein
LRVDHNARRHTVALVGPGRAGSAIAQALIARDDEALRAVLA